MSCIGTKLTQKCFSETHRSHQCGRNSACIFWPPLQMLDLGKERQAMATKVSRANVHKGTVSQMSQPEECYRPTDE